VRLWHKDLIKVLPQKQLVAQWRECCAILSNIAKKGTPNHILVNYVLSYSLDEFRVYTNEVIKEMRHRGYKVSSISVKNFNENKTEAWKYFNNDFKTSELYEFIHNDRYFWQCYFNLQEKYDRGMFSKQEWKMIEEEGKHHGKTN
jgi:uncharacterized protein (TIGR02328 family)